MSSLSKNWNDLIKPSKLEINQNVNQNAVIAEIVVEPLERGFANTLGTALRRNLLSSLQGTAVTAIRIDGVVHEFSAIPGVSEEITDIIIAVKSMIFRMNGVEKKKITLNATGPCAVTAGMIETAADVEIINKDLHICTLAKDQNLKIEFYCSVGKGYIPASQNRNEDMPIGVIPIDSLYSPVRKVSYKVENSRVGQSMDYDKLVMQIETDGTIMPDMALALSAKIMQDQLDSFITFQDVEEVEKEQEEELPFDKRLLIKVDELELSVRSQNCLKNDNIVYIGDLVRKSEAEMLKTPNFGRKSLNEIKEVLTAMSLKFGMDVVGWPPENIEELAKRFEDPY
jgi:DNA-directed RNA polymerase subunit alpha